MREEAHLQRLKESLEVLQDSVKRGLLERQRTVGFHASAAAIDYLEILLHRKRLIDPGVVLQHDQFGSREQAERRVPESLPNRKKILNLIVGIEEKRNLLCYGTPRPREEVRAIYEKFLELKEIFSSLGVEVEV